MVRRKACKQRIHLRRHTATRIATFDARDRLQKRRCPSLHNPALDSQWNPEAGSACKIYSMPHHANDRMTLSIQPDHLPNDVAVRAKMFAPDPIRNYYNRRGAHLFIGTGKVPAYRGRNPQDTKEVVRHRRAFNLYRFGFAGLKHSALAVEPS